MRRRLLGRTAVTLVELVVVLVVLGITAGVVGLTLHTARPIDSPDPVQAAIQSARDSAIRVGHRVTVTVPESGSLAPITAYPDGRVIADRTARVNELTGAADASH